MKKKQYIKPKIEGKELLRINSAIAGCSYYGDMLYQFWSNEQPAGYTAEQRDRHLAEVNAYDPEGYDELARVYCNAYPIEVTFPAGTNPNNPYQTYFQVLYMDWSGDGKINDWLIVDGQGGRAWEEYDYDPGYGDIAVSTQSGDFIKEYIGQHAGGSIAAVNS